MQPTQLLVGDNDVQSQYRAEATMELIHVLPTIISRLPVTLLVVILSGVFGLLLGIVVSYFRIKRIPVIYQAVSAYVSFARSVPDIVLLFLVFYLLPWLALIVGLDYPDVGPSVAAVIALSFHYGGYLSEVLRPAYLAVDKGQIKAGISMGYNRWQLLCRVSVPQMLPVALPGFGNAIVYLIHDSALISTIGVVDMMGRADQLIAESGGMLATQVYFIIAIVYILVVAFAVQIVRFFERKVMRAYSLRPIEAGSSKSGVLV